MRQFLICFGLIAFSGFLTAQSNSRYTQSYLTNAFYNPAAGAIDSEFTADLIYRNQWTGVDGAPDNIAFNTSYNIGSGFSIGANVLNDRIGVYRVTDAKLTPAYRFKIDSKSFINLGLGLGVNSKMNELNTVSTTTANDPVFMAPTSSTMFSASFGAFLKYNAFKLGVGIPELLQNNINGIDNGFKANQFHYFINSSYDISVNKQVRLQPNVLFKLAANSPAQFDINFRAIFNNLLGTTVGYRSENVLNFGVDFTIANKVRIGYSFNQDIGRIATYKGQSHEIYLGVALPFYGDDPFSKRKILNSNGSFKRHIR